MERIYTVMGNGAILGLGINGPLTEPTPIAINYVNTMVRRGRVIYQHNPSNLSEKVQVTPTNSTSIRFTHGKVKTPVEPDPIPGSNYTNYVESENNNYSNTQEYRNKKNKKKHHNNNQNNQQVNEEKTEVNITDVVTEEPVKVGDAFENTNIQL